ncbi:MAG: RNA-binding protein [Candidatus Woesearchaeota archaeon]|nr:RNA-binding protein [Candidatus Woesearchaeota archaeon]
MDERDYERLAKSIDPLVRIGKNGISDSFVDELIKVLKKHHLVKIKVLKAASFSGREEIERVAYDLAKRTESKVISIIGRTFTLYHK